MPAKVRPLPCALCNCKYSEEDVKNGLFHLDTMVCRACYLRMQQSPHRESCFGKRTVIVRGRKRLGYDSLSMECRNYCPDRKNCVRYMRGK